MKDVESGDAWSPGMSAVKKRGGSVGVGEGRGGDGVLGWGEKVGVDE